MGMILEVIEYLPEYKDEWIAWGINGVLDHDKSLKELDSRRDVWLYIPEKEGETMPLKVQREHVYTFNTEHMGHGCGGHHYDFVIGGQLQWD